MPWPPRLLLSPPLLPLLTVIILSSTSPPSPAFAALSYADGQPEYPSQPELTSDRDALARIFLQDLLEKEGKPHVPHRYANGEESDAWANSGRSLKRSDGGQSNVQRHFIPLQVGYPRDLNEGAYGDFGGFGEALEDQNEDSNAMEPRTERERIISELLARGHPYTGHRAHGFADPSQLSEDPDEQNVRLKELLRVVMGDEEVPSDFFRGYDERHRTRVAPKGADNGVWGHSIMIKRDPLGINARGFHDDVFNRDFGSFNPMKRVARSANEYQRKEEDARREKERAETQLRNKTQLSGFSVEGTDEDDVPKRVKRSTKEDEKSDSKTSLKPDPTLADNLIKEGDAAQVPLNRGERSAEDGKAADGVSTQQSKRRPEMDSSGFHGDTFNSGFGDFWTMKRNSHYLRPYGLSVVGKRRPEMDSSGFHGDTFNSGFGDFWTMKRAMADGVRPPGYDRGGGSGFGKRRPEMDSSGFHGDTFSSGFGDFYTMKRNPTGMPNWADREKRRPEMDSSGFHGDTFNSGFGDFWTMKRNALAHPHGILVKRRPEMDSSGFHGDTFNSGFGDFWTMKRSVLAHPLLIPGKRRPEMDSSGFHGDTFNGDFGDFWTMKRYGVPGAVSLLRGYKTQGGAPLPKGRTEEEWKAEGGDYDDRYNGVESTNFGKRRPEMDSSGFHGDTFNGGFGDFWTMKRARRDVGRGEKMDAGPPVEGLNDFWTAESGEGPPTRWTLGKLESKRRPEMDSSGFHGDTFDSGFGDFWTMKRTRPLPYAARFGNTKRRPEMDSSGFHGDTFNGGFGDFWTMKRGDGYGYAIPGRGSLLLHPNKRKPEMDSSGFHGDTFNGGFGDFWTMKRGGDAAEDEDVMNKQEAEQRAEEGGEEARGSLGFGRSAGSYGTLPRNAKDGGGDGVDKDKGSVGESGNVSGKSKAKSENVKN